MAVIDVFRQPETQAILDRLREGQKTGAELNDAIITMSDLNISTATFYRRLKELIMANVLEKDGKVYRMTPFGHKIYEEFLKTSQERRIVAPKEQGILRRLLRNQSSSKQELLSEMTGSNTELLKRIDQLEQAGYITKSSKKQKKKRRGRPSSQYLLTEKGKKTIEEVDMLKDMAMQDIIEEPQERDNTSETGDNEDENK